MSGRPRRAVAKKIYTEADSEDDLGPADNYDNVVEGQEDFSEPENRPSKKRKTASTKRKGKELAKPRRKKAGSLEYLSTLPPEIKQRILGLVAPEYLVMCLQVRPLREQLHSDQIWKMSRINAGLPALQAPDMTERKYLTLLFDKHCHDCGQPGVQHDQLDLLACARLCKPCRDNWKTYDSRKRARMIKKLHPSAEDCAKDINSGGIPMPRGIHKLSRKLYNMAPAQVDAFVEERKVLKAQILKDASAIKRWLDDQAKESYEQYSNTLEIRKAQIHQKLLEEGWTDASLPDRWERAEQVCRGTALTKGGWSRIKDTLQEHLRSEIHSRREYRREAAVKAAYQRQRQNNDLFPSWTRFKEYPTIQALLSLPRGNRPELENFVPWDQASWNAALPDTEPRVAAYGAQMRALAVQRLTDAYIAHGLPIPEDVISAPRSWFRYFEGDPPGDSWGFERVAKFPRIHAIMRAKRPTFSEHFSEGVEFETAQPPQSSYSSQEWLKVDLDYQEETVPTKINT